jgi:hypothetical protein
LIAPAPAATPPDGGTEGGDMGRDPCDNAAGDNESCDIVTVCDGEETEGREEEKCQHTDPEGIRVVVYYTQMLFEIF